MAPIKEEDRWLQSQAERSGEDKYIVTLSDIEPHFCDPSGRRLVTIPTEPAWLCI
jgi:hypothetical protein